MSGCVEPWVWMASRPGDCGSFRMGVWPLPRGGERGGGRREEGRCVYGSAEAILVGGGETEQVLV